MQRRFSSAPIVAVLAAAMVLVGATAASAITFETFVPTTINYPGATSTQARGINNPAEVVGTYVCASACTNPVTGEVSAAGTHGFVMQVGVFTRIDVPGASARSRAGSATKDGSSGSTQPLASPTASHTLTVSGPTPSTCLQRCSTTSVRPGTHSPSAFRPKASLSAAITKMV